MNRVMMEVLPTDWSPRKTSLYFARGASVPPDAGFFVAVGCVEGVAFSLIVQLNDVIVLNED